jgi:hypothetical protein
MAFKKKKNKNEIFLRCKTKTEKKSSTIGPRKPREKKKKPQIGTKTRRVKY